MAIRSTGCTQTFERHKWATQNPAVQAWVNEVIWKILNGTDAASLGSEVEAHELKDVPPDAAEVCRQVIQYNHLEGMTLVVYGEKLRSILGDSFYEEMEKAESRSDSYLQEVHWLLGPKLGAQSLLLDDYAMRRYFSSESAEALNGRFIHTLTLWTPTLATREDVIKLLFDGGFQSETKIGADSSTYDFVKPSQGLPHRIKLLGTIWESAKNWSLDLEREIFDRAVQHSTTIPLRLEVTDLFLLQCRRFSIDSIAGSATRLLDLVTLLTRESDNIDWDRLRYVKNAFAKPDWFWAALIAVAAFEIKSGYSVVMPEWAREYLKEPDSFWPDFIATRMNWANPDARLIDFPRAFVKAAKGT